MPPPEREQALAGLLTLAGNGERGMRHRRKDGGSRQLEEEARELSRKYQAAPDSEKEAVRAAKKAAKQAAAKELRARERAGEQG